MKKVIVRPGDKVTHGRFSGQFTVISGQTFKDNRGFLPTSRRRILTMNDETGMCSSWRPNYKVQLMGETVTDYVDETIAVAARPGDTITWHGTEAVVISRQEWESYTKTTRYPTVLPSEGALAWTTPEGPPTWSSVNDAELRLNGEIITHFEDATALVSPSELAGVIADRMCSLHDRPATPRGAQEPDEDGMVIGWDGRKVWL